MEDKIQTMALLRLKRNRGGLTFQQYKTLRGQVLAGDSVGAIKGLRRILERNQRSGTK